MGWGAGVLSSATTTMNEVSRRSMLGDVSMEAEGVLSGPGVLWTMGVRYGKSAGEQALELPRQWVPSVGGSAETVRGAEEQLWKEE